MLIDHAGVILFDDLDRMRLIGRLAFPLFAFCMAEGCRYTRNRLKRLLTVFGLGVICEAVYIVADGHYYGNILLTFTLSIALIYLLQEFKKHLFARHAAKAVLWGVLFAAGTAAALWYTVTLGVDYHFSGVMTAVVISLFDDRDGNAPAAFKRFDRLWVKLILLSIMLGFVAWQSDFPTSQIAALGAVPILMLYNGKPGKHRMKYAFYLFYPLHLAALQLLAWGLK